MCVRVWSATYVGVQNLTEYVIMRSKMLSINDDYFDGELVKVHYVTLTKPIIENHDHTQWHESTYRQPLTIDFCCCCCRRRCLFVSINDNYSIKLT